MKILFIGVFHKPWSTNVPMAFEFKKKGIKTICFDYRVSLKAKNKFFIRALDFIKKKSKYLFRILSKFDKYYLHGSWRINRQLLEEVKKGDYDLVFIAKGSTISYKLIPKLNNYTKTWYYYMDPLSNALKDKADKYAKNAFWSSATFSSVNAFFKRKGANSYFIPQGCNTNIFKPSKLKTTKDIDIIFVGTVSPKREIFVNFLKKKGFNIICYGVGWKFPPIYLKNLVDKYRRSKIILNFTRGKIGFSIRVLQAMGTSSFLLSEYCQDLEKFFTKGVYLEWFKTPEELLGLIRIYLSNELLREAIAYQGYEYILKRFSWDNMINKIIQIIRS